jgi:hypothetical protein
MLPYPKIGLAKKTTTEKVATTSKIVEPTTVGKHSIWSNQLMTHIICQFILYDLTLSLYIRTLSCFIISIFYHLTKQIDITMNRGFFFLSRCAISPTGIVPVNEETLKEDIAHSEIAKIKPSKSTKTTSKTPKNESDEDDYYAYDDLYDDYEDNADVEKTKPSKSKKVIEVVKPKKLKPIKDAAHDVMLKNLTCGRLDTVD